MNWPLHVTLRLFKPASAESDLFNDLARIQDIGNQNNTKQNKKGKKIPDQISIHPNNIIIQHLIWLFIIGCAVIEMEIIYSGYSVLLLNHLCAVKEIANC